MDLQYLKQLYLKQSEDGMRLISLHRQRLEYHFSGISTTYLNLKIVFVREGEALWQIGSNAIHVKPGDFIILNSSEQRRFLDVMTSTGFLMEYITFSPLTIYPNNGPLQVFFYRYPSFCNTVPRTKNYSACVQTFDSIVSEAESENGMRDEAIYGYLLTLLVNISREFEAVGAALAGKQEQLSLRNYNLICSSVAYINIHYADELTENAMAHQLGLSVSHFSRLFRGFMGVTFADYLRRLRLGRTLERLRAEPYQNILTVALECGFGSSAGFYKAVRELTDSTPTELLNSDFV